MQNFKYVCDVFPQFHDDYRKTDIWNDWSRIGPKPPENIILYTLSNAVSFLRWDPPSSPDNYFEGYRVAYRDLSPGPIIQTTLPSGVGSQVIDGLQDGLAYDFTVLTTIGQTTTSPFAEFSTITLGKYKPISAVVYLFLVLNGISRDSHWWIIQRWRLLSQQLDIHVIMKCRDMTVKWVLHAFIPDFIK